MLMNTMIFSKKAYTGKNKSEKEFAKNVLKTADIATSQEKHIELLEELYPNHKIEPLYTYEHSGMCIERFKRCEFDSSADAFTAYKKEKELEKKLKKINKELDRSIDYINYIGF